MAAMKKGTNIGLIDTHYDPIAVGDTVVAEDGQHYVITRNGYAHPEAGGKDVRPTTLGELLIIRKHDEPGDAPDPAEYAAKRKAKEAEAAKEEKAEERPFPGIANYDDQDLADELRRRGYEVKATKTITKEL